jgi:glyoxylase-like metal-dependent hydrolase (beta-lactamase superfamily II)
MASSASAYTRKIGTFEIMPVSDGYLDATMNTFVGVSLDECTQVSGLAADKPVRLPVNAFLVTAQGKRMLVDAGTSTTSSFKTLGELPDNLRAAGVPPETIETIMLTHIHPDHSNGLVDADGKPNFPNAEVIVSSEDVRYWLETDPETESHEFRKRNMLASRRAFAPYRDRVRAIKDGEILPGISAHPQPGHTPGHTGWLISSGKDSILVWGDIVHIGAVQFPRPDAALTFDVDPQAAAKARMRVFDWVTTDRVQVAGAHLPTPSFGYVVRRGTGYAFEPS